MLRTLGDVYAYTLGWPGLRRLHSGLFYLSARALGLCNYTSSSISGEHWIVRRCIGKADAPVVFDVGANDGEWLAAVFRINDSVAVHAFEPQDTLARRIAARGLNVTINNAAVGDRPGLLTLHDYADHPGSQHASLLRGVIDSVHGGTPRQTDVPVVTLDDYCRDHDIQQIAFLKIDVEGFEIQVLKGARRLLAQGRINAIQFEFTHINVLGRVFFDDFVKIIGSDFRLHRLLPHGLMPLDVRNHWFNEQFVYQNIIALREK
jgi:FkbM family methyltransferase